MPNLIELIKKAALDAVEASKPCTVVYGKVISVNPLKINVEQKLTLTKAQLIMTRNATDFKTNMTINHNTEEVTVHNSLVVGDKVLLLRLQGGQQYIVWDRLVS